MLRAFRRARVALFWVVAPLGASALVLFACAAFTPGPSAADADAGDGAPLEQTAPDAVTRACDPASKFGAPVLVKGLGVNGVSSVQAPRFTVDERTVVFNNFGIDGAAIIVDGSVSTTNFYSDIYASTRAAVTDPFSPPQAIPSLATSALESDPSLTADGRVIYFARFSAGTALSIFSADGRPGGGATELLDPVPVPAPVNEGDGGQSSPYVLLDGRALYFVSTRDGHVGFYRAARSATGVLTDVKPVPGITITAKDGVGTLAVAPDELEIYWSGLEGPPYGGVIYTASRRDTTSPFAGRRLLTELDTPRNEAPSYVSADGCRLYYTSSMLADTDAGYTLQTDVLVASKGP